MVTTKWITGDKDLQDVHMIRRVVFMGEQGVSEEDEMDGTDAGAIHLLVFEDGAPAATGRILIDAEKYVLGRIAVLKEHRGKKYGDFTMRLLIRRAFELGGTVQIVHSQVQAAGFYKKLGFKEVSGVYDDAGIPHVDMERTGDIGI